MSRRTLNRNWPLYILWLLRNRRAKDWPSLAREFGVSPDFIDTLGSLLLKILHDLREAGLIVYEDMPDDGIGFGVPIQGQIELSKNWMKIQAALDVSLTELAELGPESMVVTPYFGRPDEKTKLVDLFVMMPFDPVLKPVYEDHIVSVAQDLGLTLARGDDFFTTHSIMSDIWAAILLSRAVIADCTGRNPNVFYEIGLAHAVGKPVVLITQSNDDVPFDIRHLRYIQYEYTPRGMRIFEKRLADTLKTELRLDEGLEFINNKVLYIVADNSEKSRERLGEEFREINKMLESAGMEDRFPWSEHFLSENLGRAILEQRPKIVHITGHNGGREALIIQNHAQKAYRVRPDDLIAAFEPVSEQVECVILSACYSEEQANAIASQVNLVIGIPAAIGNATTDFAIEFYRALGAGRSIEEAYEIGCNQLRLLSVAEHLIPVLIRSKGAS
jgi:hypothetical protein